MGRYARLSANRPTAECRARPAQELDYHLAVVLPSLVPQVEFEAVAERTREALRRADIRARVVGINVP